MRKLLAVAVAVLGLVALVGCQPTEPAMTIFAATNKTPTCQAIESVNGTVTPASATSKVVLQRTSNGKWVDWKTYAKPGDQPHVLTGTVSPSGTYSIRYMVPRTTGVLHFRVRSNGGGQWSNGLYVTPWSSQPGVCA